MGIDERQALNVTHAGVFIDGRVKSTDDLLDPRVVPLALPLIPFITNMWHSRRSSESLFDSVRGSRVGWLVWMQQGTDVASKHTYPNPELRLRRTR